MNPSPAQSVATIQDLIPRVQAALQNRSDVNENQPNPEMRPSAWLRDALREITANLPFEELRQPNPPQVTIGPGLGYQGSNFKYNVSMFLNQGDDVTLMEDPVIFLTNASQAPSYGIGLTSNLIPYPMNYKSPKEIAPLLGIPGGVSYYYTRFGNQFWFGTPPGQNYVVYLPYQLRHQFSDNLLVTPVMVPPDWFDIFGYAAAERGAIALRWNEQSDYLHKKLYGDPSAQVPRPGLIEEKVMQQERDKRLSTTSVELFVQRY